MSLSLEQHAAVPYISPASGLARSAQAKMGETVSPEDFGAYGDGTSRLLSTLFGTLAAAQAVYPTAFALTEEADRAALESAQAYLVARGGGRILGNPLATYVIDYMIQCQSFVTWDGRGATIRNTYPTSIYSDIFNVGITSINAFQSKLISYSIGTVAHGERFVTMTTPGQESNFVVGQVVLLADRLAPVAADSVPTRQFWNIIQSIDTSAHTITFDWAIELPLDSSPLIYKAGGTAGNYTPAQPFNFVRDANFFDWTLENGSMNISSLVRGTIRDIRVRKGRNLAAWQGMAFCHVSNYSGEFSNRFFEIKLGSHNNDIEVRGRFRPDPADLVTAAVGPVNIGEFSHHNRMVAKCTFGKAPVTVTGPMCTIQYSYNNDLEIDISCKNTSGSGLALYPSAVGATTPGLGGQCTDNYVRGRIDCGVGSSGFLSVGGTSAYEPTRNKIAVKFTGELTGAATVCAALGISDGNDYTGTEFPGVLPLSLLTSCKNNVLSGMKFASFVNADVERAQQNLCRANNVTTLTGLRAATVSKTNITAITAAYGAVSGGVFSLPAGNTIMQNERLVIRAAGKIVGTSGTGSIGFHDTSQRRKFDVVVTADTEWWLEAVVIPLLSGGDYMLRVDFWCGSTGTVTPTGEAVQYRGISLRAASSFTLHAGVSGGATNVTIRALLMNYESLIGA